MSNLPPNLAETLDQAWRLLEHNETMRMGVLASLDEFGAPQARMVALRNCDRKRNIVATRTDLLSSKINGLRADPRVTFHFWVPENLVQLRLSGTASIVTGPKVRDLWDQTPVLNREPYSHVPSPGTPIAASDNWLMEPSPDRFAILEIALAHIDAVNLDPTGHRRAEFLRDDDWQGQWLSP